jgi:hypothetical protein
MRRRPPLGAIRPLQGRRRHRDRGVNTEPGLP